MTSITFTAVGTAAEAVVTGKLTAGIVGVPVTFNLNEEWGGLNVIALFEGGGNSITVPLLGRTTAVLPWEVVARPNIRLRIGAEGRADDGSTVIPTVWADAGYIVGGVNFTQASDPSPTAYDILLAEIKKVSEGHLAVVDDLETADSTKALSANMGKVLSQKIDNDLLAVQKELEAEIERLDANRVKSVNGIYPDENGEVTLDIPTEMDIDNRIETATDERFVTLEEAVQGIIDDLNYKAIDITALSNTAGGTHEFGTVITGYTLNWSLNKEPVSQTLDGVSIGADVRSVTESDLKIIDNRTFTLKVTDERGATDTAATSISFLNGVYYGVLEDGAAIDSAAVLDLTRKLQGSKTITFTADAGTGQRIAYAFPTRYSGVPVFNVGGFEGGFSLASTFQFTNASGYTETYDVYLSDNTGLGSTTVKVS